MKTWLKVMLVMVLVLAGLAGGQAYAAGKGKAEVKDKKLQFVDETGKVVRTISLEEEFREVPKKDRKAKIRQKHYKRVSMSKNGSYAFILTDITDWDYIDETGQEHSIDEGTVTSNLKVFDGMGNVLLTKQFREGWGVKSRVHISDQGEALAVQLSGDAMGTDEVSNEPVYVYDMTGKVLMSAPTKADIEKWPDFNIDSVEAISSNGKYLAITVSYGYTLEFPTVTRFYNLHNGRFWDAEKNYVVYWIANSGETHVGSKKISGESEDIDLKNYIGD